MPSQRTAKLSPETFQFEGTFAGGGLGMGGGPSVAIADEPDVGRGGTRRVDRLDAIEVALGRVDGVIGEGGGRDSAHGRDGRVRSGGRVAAFDDVAVGKVSAG